MQLQSQTALFDLVKARYPEIYTIVSPPRCSSTAFARVFWEHPSTRYYSHEPFEVTYFHDAELDSVQQMLMEPLDLKQLNPDPNYVQGESLIIKEMPYQVWHNFPLLVDLSTAPIIFLIRDPRININSRMDKKKEVGDSPLFPHIETGWTLIQNQIDFCAINQIPYLLIDGADFRSHPTSIFQQIFEALNLDFSQKQLSWQPQKKVDLDNLDGTHQHLYHHVLHSKGMEPDNQIPTPLSSFPSEQGYREHVATCLEIYTTLRQNPARIKP